VHSESWVNCEESIYSRPIACRLARSLALYPPRTSRLAFYPNPRHCDTYPSLNGISKVQQITYAKNGESGTKNDVLDLGAAVYCIGLYQRQSCFHEYLLTAVIFHTVAHRTKKSTVRIHAHPEAEENAKKSGANANESLRSPWAVRTCENK